ncbi:MAG: glycoside hydrolase family 24 [Alphaproteobacteria bacterium]|nr:MAG: glycoside hydrolase family 24 [Alphaproteobacteria bacterium]
MPLIASFHEVVFPLRLAFGSSGGPVRRTEVVALASGHEQRNARWSQSRRRFDAGQAMRGLDDLYETLAFFEARKGRLFGFRFRDPLDWKSCPPGLDPAPADQPLGEGDGATTGFDLVKSYGADEILPRRIAKPVVGSVRVAVAGVEQTPGSDFTVDHAAGTITFMAAPVAGAPVTAGFAFDLPVRFDTDEIVVNLAAFAAGDIPSVPVLEILP